MIHRLILLGALCYGTQAQEGRWILCEVTAYCGGPCEQCETTGVTANGTNTVDVPYGVAGSPNLPLGCTVLVPYGAGYLDATYPRDSQRLFELDDRGGALRTEWRKSGVTRLDLRYKQHSYAQRFGRKTMMVWIEDAQPTKPRNEK